MSRAAIAFLVALALAATGCEPRPPEHLPDVEPLDPPLAGPEMPDALLVRFETVAGTALARDGWEIEVLQMGGEVRVRGSVTSRGVVAPIFRIMTEPEYVDFWEWLSGFPLDGHRVEQDVEAPQAGWRKTCKVDIVLGDQRILAENRWTRPLSDPDWMQQLEDRLHLLALDYAEASLDTALSPEETAEIDDGLLRALDALEEE